MRREILRGGLDRHSLVYDPEQPACLPPKTHCLLSLGFAGSDHFRRDKLGSSRTFGSLFHLSWDCLWVLLTPSSNHCYCGLQALLFSEDSP